MPHNKDLKRLVRSRMKKTGESYTAARAQLTRKKTRSKTTAAASAATPAIDYAALAGMSDDAVKAATGCGWRKWVYVLDRAGARDMPHAAIAKLLAEKWGVPPWWRQAVAVGYERIHGLRAVGQRRSGEWGASKSRTFPVGIDTLFDACARAAVRARWLGRDITVRTATANRSIRITWPDGTRVEMTFQAKGAAKSTVSVEHTKLASKEDVDARKKFWAERLAELGKVLAG